MAGCYCRAHVFARGTGLFEVLTYEQGVKVGLSVLGFENHTHIHTYTLV